MFRMFNSRDINLDQIVHNWQHWLQVTVFEYPVYCTRADRQGIVLNPKLSIRVEPVYRKEFHQLSNFIGLDR